jgi:hypothetical protein
VQLVKAELTETEDGGARLKVPLLRTRWSSTFLRVPDGATKTFELDPIGLFVWKACDGKTSVQQIIRKLSKEHKLTLREVEVSTIMFLQTLARKGLIGLEVLQEGVGGREDSK